MFRHKRAIIKLYTEGNGIDCYVIIIIIIKVIIIIIIIFYFVLFSLYEGWIFNSGNYLFTTDTK